MPRAQGGAGAAVLKKAMEVLFQQPADASVVEGSSPREALLGMSFLNQFVI